VPDKSFRRHAVHACPQEPTRGNDTSAVQAVQVLGSDGEHVEISACSNPANRISGVPNQFKQNDNNSVTREGEKGAAGGNETYI